MAFSELKDTFSELLLTLNWTTKQIWKFIIQILHITNMVGL